MTTCLNIEDFERLKDETLSLGEAERVSAHLRTCPDCRERREDWLANQAYMNRVAGALGGSAPGADPKTVTVTRTTSFVPSPSGDAAAPFSIPGYELGREIHRGGQGVVYEALQLSTKRKVAVKVMLEGPFASRASRDRFQREVELVAALRHPNIVVIHESGEAHGNAYFAMDYIEGRRLDDYVRAAALLPRGVAALMRKVCDAVCAAHRQGVMHRDLKPSNVLVAEDREQGTPTKSGLSAGNREQSAAETRRSRHSVLGTQSSALASAEPKVLDFGLAKWVTPPSGADRSGPEITRLDHIMGTLKYMSPEQTRGGLQLVDIRTDVYSLGVILFELLTGAAPYRTDLDLPDAINNIREAMPVRPSRLNRRVNSELDAITLKALEKNPERRYQSAGELGEDLAAWLEGRPVSAKANSSLYLIRKIAVRHRSATAIVTAFIVTILSLSAVSVEGYLQATEALRERDSAEMSAIRSERKAAGFQGLHFDGVRLIVFGSFLADWRGGRFEEAARYADMLTGGSPEKEAARFLMDPAYAPEQLRQKLGPADAALAHFAVGEREWKAGNREAAVEAFKACIASAGEDAVLKALAGTRLKGIHDEEDRSP